LMARWLIAAAVLLALPFLVLRAARADIRAHEAKLAEMRKLGFFGRNGE